MDVPFDMVRDQQRPWARPDSLVIQTVACSCAAFGKGSFTGHCGNVRDACADDLAYGRLTFVNSDSKGTLHHIELWVPDLGRAKQEWGWVLAGLGYSIYQSWATGISWRLGLTYIVAEQSPAMSSSEHERTLPGLNHLAFHAGSKEGLDAFVEESRRHGWVQLFQDKYPHAGGPEHYAAYLVNSDGFELELVATT
jgi:hypothetical protein